MNGSTLPLRNKRVVVAVMHVPATDAEGDVVEDGEIAAWVADNMRDAGWDPVGISVYGGFVTSEAFAIMTTDANRPGDAPTPRGSTQER